MYYIIVIKYVAIHDVKMVVVILMMAWALILAVPPGSFSDCSDSLKLSFVIGTVEHDLRFP